MGTVGSRLRHKRKALGLTQVVFAKKLGYSRSYFNEIELDNVKPSARFLEALSKHFNISIDTLLYGENEDDRGKALTVLRGVCECGRVFEIDMISCGLKVEKVSDVEQ